jgi:4-amino-4-deoxy-L-arabinose transferase-like glycosyltransferase
MLNLLPTFIFAIGCVGLGMVLLDRLRAELDPALRVGLGGMIGLAAIGTMTLFMGLLPDGLRWGIALVGVIVLVGLVALLRSRPTLQMPRGNQLLFPLVLAVFSLFPLIGVLAPSDANDWDTLSHHLASVKIWIGNGQITDIPFMHQSNFPFAVDNLYIWGHEWGGQTGAKGFAFAFFVLGMIAIFGMTRQRFGSTAAWWAALFFACVPVVLWESGTAYIDVAHGLFAGFGILFGASLLSPDHPQPNMWLAAICLGFAAGTKYTGLQTIFAVCLVLALACLILRRRGRLISAAALVAVIALAIASPWYIKNAIWKGNPVYPFFYGQLGGVNWDKRRADVYQNEQRTFGVGREQMAGPPKASIDLGQVGHAVLGLAYQPGRFTNPGQTVGFGDPSSAIGFATIGVFLLLLWRGRPDPADGAALFMIGLSLLMWFVLSQQSRYIVTLVPVIAVLSGALLAARGGWKWLTIAAVALQSVLTLYLFKFGPQSRFDSQIRYVTGAMSADEYLAGTPFYAASKILNELPRDTTKVALYDEVFGWFLRVPYFWANPGHCTLIPYDHMGTGEDYAREMKRMGFTHVYVAGRSGEAFPYAPLSPEEARTMMDNWEVRWKPLVFDAVSRGLLVPSPVQSRGGVIFVFR